MIYYIRGSTSADILADPLLAEHDSDVRIVAMVVEGHDNDRHR